MARRAGARALLVLTGISTAAEAASAAAARAPHAVLDDIRALVPNSRTPS
jgi:ribonucleotide monophosphatase NagD (HAD superfamily)